MLGILNDTVADRKKILKRSPHLSSAFFNIRRIL